MAVLTRALHDGRHVFRERDLACCGFRRRLRGERVRHHDRARRDAGGYPALVETAHIVSPPQNNNVSEQRFHEKFRLHPTPAWSWNPGHPNAKPATLPRETRRRVRSVEAQIAAPPAIA